MTSALSDHERSVRLLRVCYWIGAVVDLVAAAQMLSPRLFALAYGLDDFRPDAAYRYAMGMGASLMVGWTALLLWADRRPHERRGVLLLTIFPVIAGLVVNEIAAVRAGFVAPVYFVPAWGFQAGYTVLCVVAYVRAGRSLG